MTEGWNGSRPAGHPAGGENDLSFASLSGPADGPTKRFHLLLLATCLGLLAWSGIGPRDRIVWLLEVLPVLAGGAVLLGLYRRFRLTTLVYVLIWAHAAILMIGGHWTYAGNPIFSAIRDGLGLQRNYYDRLGHIAQGFVPAMIAREVLLRTSPLRPGKWLSFIVASICLAVSAGYEFFEWWAAVATGEGDTAVRFLATQGDVWDTQWDMLLCLCGAVAALVLLSGTQDRALAGQTMPARRRMALFLAMLALVVAAIVTCYVLPGR